MLCSLCGQLGPYSYLNGDDSDHYLPGYTLDHLRTSSVTCELCRLLLSKALLYPQVHEDGIELYARSGTALYLNKKGTGAAIYTDTIPFCTEPYPVGDNQNTQSEGPPCEGRLPHSDTSSTACIELARRWLLECLDSHEK